MDNTASSSSPSPSKCGFVAVLGLPNAGKSTLINALVGEKVTITSRKAQTTRMQVKGIALHDASQIVLLDTPGIFQARRNFDKSMVEAAWAGLDEAELCLLIVDVSKKNYLDDHMPLIKRLETSDKPKWLILNKIDQIKRDRLLEITAKLNDLMNFDKTFMISALKESGTQDLLETLAQAMPDGPWAYDGDQVSDLSMRALAAEITREQIYDQIHDEIPYAIHVTTETWEDFNNGDVKIGQLIYVQRDSQKALVLGRGGSKIKKLGEMARSQLSEILERKVHLTLLVKVQENWMDRPEFLNEYGFAAR